MSLFTFSNTKNTEKCYAEESAADIISLDSMWTVSSPQWVHLMSLLLPLPEDIRLVLLLWQLWARAGKLLTDLISQQCNFSKILKQKKTVTWAQHWNHAGGVCLNFMAPGPPQSKCSRCCGGCRARTLLYYSQLCGATCLSWQCSSHSP